MNESGRAANMWDLVLVVWHDAYHTNSPGHTSDRTEYVPCVRKSVGWVVAMTAEHIEIAQTDDREGTLEESDHDEALTLPLGIVQKVIRLLGSGGRSDALRDSS